MVGNDNNRHGEGQRRRTRTRVTCRKRRSLSRPPRPVCLQSSGLCPAGGGARAGAPPRGRQQGRLGLNRLAVATRAGRPGMPRARTHFPGPCARWRRPGLPCLGCAAVPRFGRTLKPSVPVDLLPPDRDDTTPTAGPLGLGLGARAPESGNAQRPGWVRERERRADDDFRGSTALGVGAVAAGTVPSAVVRGAR